MKRYYIGLATTFHDPAIAIVGPDGEVLYAEAVERHCGEKRGLNQDPDTYLRMPKLLEEFCDPDAEIVIATTWSSLFTNLLRYGTAARAFSLKRLRSVGSRVNRALLEDDDELAYASLIYHMQEKAGLGVLNGVKSAFGHKNVRLRRYPHHLTHAAHACFTSPFKSAVCAIVDGMGEFGSMASFRYQDGRIRPIYRHWGRESVGFLYALVTKLCGYDWRLGEEWKVMGLAGYGEEDRELAEILSQIYRMDDGKLRFNSRRRIRSAVERLHQRQRRHGYPATDRASMACAGQDAFRRIMNGLLSGLCARGFSRNLVFGGGCALNSSYNGEITTSTGFEQLYVPCAPGDDGNAVGAALLAYQHDHPDDRRQPRFQTPYLGSSVSRKVMEQLPIYCGSKITYRPESVHLIAAELIARGKVVGWMQGRAEFGPRALGNRSILADPRSLDIRSRISERVKDREVFRPYAPSILDEHGPRFFSNYQMSPYMERSLRYRLEEIGRVPAVVHVDKTGRAQTVRREWNPKFHDLITRFYQLTGVPLVLNTSLNVRGKPIVNTIEEAIGMFHTTGLDALVIEDYVLEK